MSGEGIKLSSGVWHERVADEPRHEDMDLYQERGAVGGPRMRTDIIGLYTRYASNGAGEAFIRIVKCLVEHAFWMGGVEHGQYLGPFKGLLEHSGSVSVSQSFRKVLLGSTIDGGTVFGVQKYVK